MIVLYPGSFNPIHTGHIRLAEYMLTQPNVEEVWLLISPNNPLKKAKTLWDEKLRLALVEVAIEDKKRIRASDFEFALPRPSYTANTLRALAKAYPEKQFALLIGEDNMRVFDQWREYEWIAANYPIYVYPREGGLNGRSPVRRLEGLKAATDVHNTFHILEDAPLCAISSTQIRERLAEVNVDAGVDFERDEILRWVPENIRAQVMAKG